MDLQRTEYPAILKSLQPPQAVQVLTDRIAYIKAVNAEFAEWLGERKRIEEQYAVALNRLASRSLNQNGSKLDLGVFETPWNKIVASTTSIANSHHQFAYSIDREVESPLRAFASSSREMSNMDNILGNVQALARDVDAANKKADKLNNKGSKADAQKVASAATDVEDAESQWDSQAPYVFERLQELDVLRLELLQKCLTQYQTFADETRNSTSTSVEECLNALLNVQIADEIVLFSQKSRRNTATTRERRLSRPQVPVIAESSSLAPPPVPSQYDASSIRSGSLRENAPQEPKRSKIGDGLKRFSTVLKGRRNSTHPYGQQLPSPEKKRSSTNVSSKFPGFQKKSKDNTDTLSPQSTGNAFHLNAQPAIERRTSDISASRSLERVASARSTTQQPEAVAEEPALVNGNHLPEIPALSDPSTALFDPAEITTPMRQAQETIPPQPSQALPIAPVKQASPVADTFPAPSQPHSGSNAIDQALDEASMSAPQSQFKVDIKSAPIQEEDADASAALANVATALRSQATPKRAPTLRGRRDRNTIILPTNAVPQLPTAVAAETQPPAAPDTSIEAPESSATLAVPALTASTSSGQPSPVAIVAAQPSPLAQSTPLKATSRSALLADDTAGSDTHSIRSGRSLSSNISSTIRHPEMSKRGLNASIVETVNAWFEAGVCVKAVLLGEIALVHNATDTDAESDTIRFDNFETLEKVAPNPLFIESVAGKTGTYALHLSHIQRLQVAFKYQTLVEPQYLSLHAPLRLVPAWKVDASQTLVMLSYSFNPDFAAKLAPETSSVTLSNVVMIVHLDPGVGKILRCQAQGGGTYSRERNLAYWRLNEVTLPCDGSPQVLRARFFTDGEAVPGQAEARWELSSEQLVSSSNAISISRLEGHDTGFETTANDPFADDDVAATPTTTWSEVETIRTLRSGTYVGSV